MPQWDRIDVDGSPMRLHVGTPSLGRAFPAVIVIQHGPGVDKFIEDRVENLAQQGYLAIAPDLYHRQTSPAAGVSSVRVPGDGSMARYRRALAAGVIHLDDRVYSKILALSADSLPLDGGGLGRG